MRIKTAIGLAAVLLWLAPAGAQERQGARDLAWLVYRPVNATRVFAAGVPDTFVVLGLDVLEQSAARELALGFGAECCSGSLGSSWAETTCDGPDGWYDVTVRYFDLLHGRSHFSLSIAGNQVDAGEADNTLSSDKLNGHTSTREVIRGASIHHDGEIRVIGHPDGNERAPLDYMEILPNEPSPDASIHPEQR